MAEPRSSVPLSSCMLLGCFPRLQCRNQNYYPNKSTAFGVSDLRPPTHTSAALPDDHVTVLSPLGPHLVSFCLLYMLTAHLPEHRAVRNGLLQLLPCFCSPDTRHHSHQSPISWPPGNCPLHPQLYYLLLPHFYWQPLTSLLKWLLGTSSSLQRYE